VLADVRQGEQFPQGPADPKIFLHADGL
jgi:hypothetical protein